MAIFDKFLNSVRLVDDDDYDDDYDYEDEYDEDEEDEPKKRGFFGFGRKKKDEEDEIEEEAPAVVERRQRPAAASNPKITPMRSARSSVKMELSIAKPSSFEDVQEIADALLLGKTVVLNTEGIDFSLAQRIIDFTTGSCYAISGNLQQISNYIFLITPRGVNISGDMQGLADAFGRSGISSSMGSVTSIGTMDTGMKTATFSAY